MNPNGKSNVLTALATSGDTWVKLGTLALVAISGIANWWTTENTSADNRTAFEAEIHQIYEALNHNKDEFRQLVKDAHDTALSNTVKLKNQAEILEGQQQILETLREGQKQFIQRQHQEP